MADTVDAARLQACLHAAFTRTRLVKALEEQRYVLGVAYPASRLDGHGEFMGPAELEQTAWGYLRKGRQVGLVHAEGLTGHGTVVESYIYRGPDWSVLDAAGGQQVVKAGDWLLGVQFDEKAWPLIKSRRLDGWSIDGVARRRSVPRSTVEES